MTDFSKLFKGEIARLARKEVRLHAEPLRKLVAALKADVAQLKRQVRELQAENRRLSRANRASTQAASPAAGAATNGAQAPSRARFSAKGLVSLRKRLGLSAADFGLLVGVSGQSVYGWEQGTSRPRARALAAIHAVRGLGKKEAAKRIEAVRAGG